MTPTPVEDLMTTPVLTVAGDEDAAAVAQAMRDQDIKSVVITDEDCQAAGILTSTDFVDLAADDRQPGETSVSAYMTTTVVTAEHDGSVPTVAARMREHDIAHIPVIDDEGQVVGILTATDLTDSLAEPPAEAAQE
jgi:CBS domain-containing protein